MSESADSSVADKLIFKALAFSSSTPFTLTLAASLDVWVLETMTKVPDWDAHTVRVFRVRGNVL
jgi:hypothetical protein